MILVNICYQYITPESAEDGEFSDSFMYAENAEYSFRELVQALKRVYNQASCSPASGSIFEWYETGFDIIDYRTGEEENKTIHYSRDNPARKAKYWKKAAIAAGIVK